MLLLNPGWYYQINRKFRTLANDSPDLANGPLSGFSAEDFTHGDYRLLMQIFQEALNQDEQDPLDFMREQANDTLIHEMELCLMEELEGVQNHVKHRMQGETVAVWKHHERFTLPTLNLSAELIFTSLTLRQRRLQREREELRFLQLDSQNDGAEDEINRYIMLSMRAKTLIDTELKDFYHNFS